MLVKSCRRAGKKLMGCCELCSILSETVTLWFWSSLQFGLVQCVFFYMLKFSWIHFLLNVTNLKISFSATASVANRVIRYSEKCLCMFVMLLWSVSSALVAVGTQTFYLTSVLWFATAVLWLPLSLPKKKKKKKRCRNPTNSHGCGVPELPRLCKI